MINYDDLINKALDSRKFAQAPHSGFRVGAALLTSSGEVVTGCNVESSSYGLTMCAERVALYKALSEGHTKFEAIAIASDSKNFCPPCGACRQVLWDYAPDLPVILISDSKNFQIIPLGDLFSYPFDKQYLKNDSKK